MSGRSAAGVLTGGLNPFSPQGFQTHCEACAYPLSEAVSMISRPWTYGVDAGKAVDAKGNLLPRTSLYRTMGETDWRPCAVLVPVIAREPEATLLFTRRTAHLKAHAGQIAFPGGKIEPQDGTPVETALREAHEEIGLDKSHVRPLALLDLHRTGTGFRIVPVLALVQPEFTPQPDPHEVDDIFEVPLTFLMREENHQRHFAEWNGQRRMFYAMTYRNRFIWGATAAMVRNLYERLYAR